MSTKREGCATYDKIGEDEPFFVLRGQDVLAPVVVRRWITLARENGVPEEKLAEAERCEERMLAWGPGKVPD